MLSILLFYSLMAKGFVFHYLYCNDEKKCVYIYCIESE